MPAALELGLGAREVLATPGAGRVAGVYSKAVYLRLPGGLVALTTYDVPPGPLHARCRASLGRIRLDDRVVVTGSLLQAGPVQVDLEGARLWRGELPGAAALDRVRNEALSLLQSAPPSALEPDAVEHASHLLRHGDLAGVAARLGGAGPGLTPAGDDCLAGILLAARILWGEPAAAVLEQAASGVETNDISRAFLHWAARGQSIEPAHRFLAATAAGESGPAAGALAELAGFGHSSGADLALGLRLGLSACRLPAAWK